MIYSSQSGRTQRLVQAARVGAEEQDVEVRLLRAADAGLDDLLWAQGLLIGTPENFGYMSGAVKDFMDRTYYPAEGKTISLPYALLVSAGNDGSGAVRAVERIATGYGWKAVADPLIVKGEPDAAALSAAQELGGGLAAGLSAGIF